MSENNAQQPRYTIHQVANGFLVRPDLSPSWSRGRDEIFRDEEVYVFQTFAEMVTFLGRTYPHRNGFVDGDRPTPSTRSAYEQVAAALADPRD